MTRAKLGDWRWHMGQDEDDDEMMDCGTREQAIADGNRQYREGETFYIVQARMRLSDEKGMAAGRIDTAPFAKTRMGQFVKAGGAA